ALYDERGRMFGSAPAGMPTLDQSALMTAIQRSKAMGVEAESGEPIALHPLHIADGSLVIAAFAGRAAEAAALTDARQRMLVTALITLMGTLALGFVITRLLIRPIKQLTERAEELSLRFAGRSVPRTGGELQSLVGAFEAMTNALLGHSDRLKQAHLNELQNSL